MMRSVLTIGDCIIDEIHFESGEVQRFAGGAGLNLASGVSTLGVPSIFMTRVGQDRDGYYLLNYARRRGLIVLETPSVDPTGIVISTRWNGEPSYSFGPMMYRRRFLFDRKARDVISSAAIVAINSFPLDNVSQTDELADALNASSAIKIIDPNPRPRLIHNIDAYRAGFEKISQTASMAKISDEDAQILYSAEWPQVTARLFDLGVQTVLISHGAGGARIVERSGLSTHVPVAKTADPIVDTMGAGDATLASIIAWIIQHGRPQSVGQWQDCLSRAMAVASATCRNAGAELTLP